jgi:phosphatidylserine/phosphatidylglycerophosphate/cardiolipin synthase-like enzyme
MSQFTTSLHNEKTFYSQFIRDLENCKREIIIESPLSLLKNEFVISILKKLNDRGVNIFIITRDPKEHIANTNANQKAKYRHLRPSESSFSLRW